jgi:hypothetical protein
MIDAATEQVGQPGVVTMASTGDAVLDKPEIQPVSGPDWKDKAALLAFMEEPVTVVVHTSSDKYAVVIPEIWVDGRVQRFLRGEEMIVKRKFVEGLARAKLDTFQNQEYTDENGDRNFRYPKSVALKYPFAVTHDANPRGGPWLKKILAEG